MEIETQKSMALAGFHMWVRGVIELAEALNSYCQDTASNNWQDIQPKFHRNRHYYLIAAHKVIEHLEWLLTLEMVSPELIGAVWSHKENIKRLRDMNEHVIEYFIGRGYDRERWNHSDEFCIADASSTVEDRIGGRLSWNEFAQAVGNLARKLPMYYYPKREPMT